MKFKLKPILGFSTAIFFIYLVLRHIDIEQVNQSIKSTKLSFIGVAIISFLIGYFCRIERWRLMLIVDNPSIKWRQVSGPFLASVAANNILPLRAGDIMRAVLFNNSLAITLVTSVTSLVVERLLDLLMVLWFMGIALWWLDVSSSELVDVGSSFLIFSSALIGLILFYPKVFKPLCIAIASFVEKLHTEFGRKLLNQSVKVFESLSHISHKNVMPKLLFWSALAWIFEGLTFFFVALSLTTITKPIAAWLALPIGTLSTIIPSAPGYVGTFDFFTSRSMAILGNASGASAVYAFLVHLVIWLPPTILGGSYILINKISPNSLKNK